MKHALLCGAAQGLGKSVAQKFLSENWRVSILDLKIDPDLEKKGALFYPCDLTNERASKESIENIFEKRGKVDALVNCIRYRGKDSPPSSFLNDWKKPFEIDFHTYLVASHLVCELSKETLHPCSIINFSSITSQLVSLKESLSYHTAKAAIHQMTRYLAVAYGPFNIRVNAIAPGLISRSHAEPSSNAPDASLYAQLAQYVPLRRSGAPEEVAQLVFFLASPISSFITGQEITIDGGLSLCEQTGVLSELWKMRERVENS